MRLVVVAALLPLLAACSRTPSPPPAPALPDTPEVAACREEARNSPEVRDIAHRTNLANTYQTSRMNALRDDAEARAFNDCLRRRGIIRGGGVERVRPRGY